MQPEGGVAHQDLGVLQAFAVVGHVHVDLGGIFLDRVDGGGGLSDVARGQSVAPASSVIWWTSSA